MNQHHGAIRALILGSFCAALAACDTSLAELGAYPRQLVDRDGGLAPAEDAVAVAPAQDAQVGTSDSAPPLGPSQVLPSCLPDNCVTNARLSVPGEHCYEVNAHAPGDASAPYRVAMAPEIYVNFTTRVPGDGAQYLRSFGVLIVAGQVLHDMRLYTHSDPSPADVHASPTPTLPPGARLISSWGPGLDTVSLHPELGIALAPGAWYTLQAHYSNSITGRELDDKSGFRVCTTSTPPAHLVSFSKLGADVAGITARGQCTPQHDGEIFLLAGLPRMNVLGQRISLSVRRAGGEDQRLFDRVFAFDEQSPTLLNGARTQPGDTLTTECRYREQAQGGPGIRDELCDLYVLHWPARALRSGSDGELCRD